MGIPLVQQYRIGRYILEQKLKRRKRYPLVLMLEPLFQCNLACAGCGKIDYSNDILRKRMSVEDALKAVDECGAPVVSIPGGEPLIHKEMPQIVEGIVARKKLSTSARTRCSRAEDRSVQAVSLSHVLDPPRWQQGTTRRVGLPRGHVRQGRLGDQAGPLEGIPRHGQLHALCR
jgi:MoaA/NifB/PqqE/SkfB family radical SAM enzyme